jgi:spore maturation protein SpmA
VLWLGIFEIAQQAGIVQKMARLIAPVLGRLMPDVPRDHPAHASATMNIAMSMLGIDNGALAAGLKTMQALETLNPTPGTASRAQQMFLVYMTASVTVFPVSILVCLLGWCIWRWRKKLNCLTLCSSLARRCL